MALSITLKQLSIPENKRLLVASDIHAHPQLLLRLLKKANYSPENDILVITGDFVEKGPDSLGTLRTVMQLCKNGPVYPLIGNVDHWRYCLLMSDEIDTQKTFVANAISYREWWPSTWLHEMCREAGYEVTLDMDTPSVFPILRKLFAPEIEFLESLPTLIETDEIIFAHSGLPHERLHELVGTPRKQYIKWDHFMEDGLSFQKYVVVGHWPTALYSTETAWYNPVIDHKSHIISIDGGCGVKNDGQLNLLILPGGHVDQLSYISCHDLPFATAMDAQEGSDQGRFIHWGDHDVEMVEKGEEMSQVLHHGTKVSVPTSYLYESKGQLCCSDVATAILSINPGDELGIITQLSDRCYVKKDGVHGWYFGKFTNKETES
ncbi:MAG: metallophosphoesterase [Clostridiales bacterium]|nr:metallophosphoesterase [Clostridiales bacterium]